jgi:hypothetical protein
MRALIILLALGLAACSSEEEPDKLDTIIVLPDASLLDLPPPDLDLPCKEGCRDITYIKRCQTYGTWQPTKGHCPSQTTCGRCVTSADGG